KIRAVSRLALCSMGRNNSHASRDLVHRRSLALRRTDGIREGLSFTLYISCRSCDSESARFRFSARRRFLIDAFETSSTIEKAGAKVVSIQSIELVIRELIEMCSPDFLQLLVKEVAVQNAGGLQAERARNHHIE